MNPSTVTPVVVIGAGPVGLLCALALAKQNISVLVLEAEPALTVDLRAGTFHPPTLEVLAPLGLTEKMMAQGIKVPRWQTRDFREGLIAEWDLSILKDDTPYPYRLHLEQHRFTPIVMEMLSQYPNAQVKFGAKFTGLIQHEDHVAVTVDTADGPRQFACQWLIGADGGRSSVRKACGIEFVGYTWPERYTVISTTEDFGAYGYADNAYISDPEQWIAVFRMPGDDGKGLWRLTVPVTGDMDDAEVLAPAYAERVMSRVTGRAGPFAVTHQNVYRVHQRVAANFRQGRVLLAGDAAHVNNPLGGFGLNSGIHDAVTLTRYLLPVLHGEADDRTLDDYAQKRKLANIEYVQNMSVKNKQNLEESDPAKRHARFASLRKTLADPTAAREFLLASSMLKEFRSQ